MKLKTSTSAPSFQAESLGSKLISLEDYKGKNLLVKFYRFATCPICNLHLRNFVKQYNDLQKEDLSVVAIYHSPKWRMEKNFTYDIPFEVLSDPDKKIFHKYGVGSSLAGMFSWSVMRDYFFAMKAGFPSGMLSNDGGIKGLPADFIVNKEGKIIYTHYGKNYADSLSVEEVISVARQLKLSAGSNNKAFSFEKEFATV